VKFHVKEDSLMYYNMSKFHFIILISQLMRAIFRAAHSFCEPVCLPSNYNTFLKHLTFNLIHSILDLQVYNYAHTCTIPVEHEFFISIHPQGGDFSILLSKMVILEQHVLKSYPKHSRSLLILSLS
jgi:hypothetical protein